MDILVIAGVEMSTETIKSRVADSFGERISVIVRQTLEIRKVVGENMLSSEFEFLFPSCGRHFRGEWMIDAEGTGSSHGRGNRLPDGQLVLCTTELGLSRHEKTSHDESRNGIESNIIIKAKVMLHSVVEEFLQQQRTAVAAGESSPDSSKDVPPVSSLEYLVLSHKLTSV